jgi:hypothetical protein
MILSTKTGGQDVCAVTCDISLDQPNPVFNLLFAKNKATPKDDMANATELCEIVRKYAVASDRKQFFEEMYSFIIRIQGSRWAKFSRQTATAVAQILPSLLSHVEENIVGPIDVQDENLLTGDKYLVKQSQFYSISVADTILATLSAIGKIAKAYETTPTAKLVGEISALGSILSTSRAYRNIALTIQSRDVHNVMKEFFETLTTLGMYWNGIDILKQYCIESPYKESLAHLTPKFITPPTGGEIRKIATKYNLSVSQQFESEEAETPQNYFDVVALRQHRARIVSSGWQEDWEMTYRRITNMQWTPAKNHWHEMHAEVQLGMYLLHSGNTDFSRIGISKSPCYCCRQWFTAVQHRCPDRKFLIPTSHQKVYGGWVLSRVKEVDDEVIKKVWEELPDRVMESVTHVDTKDARHPTFQSPAEGIEAVRTFQELESMCKLAKDGKFTLPWMTLTVAAPSCRNCCHEFTITSIYGAHSVGPISDLRWTVAEDATVVQIAPPAQKYVLSDTKNMLRTVWQTVHLCTQDIEPCLCKILRHLYSSHLAACIHGIRNSTVAV